MRGRSVGGGAGEPVDGGMERVLDVGPLLLQVGETGVQPGQPLVDERGELEPRVDRGAAVRVVAPADRRDRVQRPDLPDQRQLPVVSLLRRRVLLPQPLDLALQRVGHGGAERLGLGLHPCLDDAYPGGTRDASPQGPLVQRARQSRHPHAAARRHAAPRQAAADRALRVHHDRIEDRTPPVCCLSRHVLRPPPCPC